MLLRDIARDEPGVWDFRGLVAPHEPHDDLLERIDAPFLGDPTGLAARMPPATGWHFVVGVGSPAIRRSMDAVMRSEGLRPATLIHPTAAIGDDATVHTQAIVNRGLTIGSGAVVGAGAVVTRDVDPATTVVGVPARPIR